jgi:hypothetical protein
MKVLVITTVLKEDNQIISRCIDTAMLDDIKPLIILDKNSGDLSDLPGKIINCEVQDNLELRLAKLLPWNSYSRKNLGYLLALLEGANWIIETDDDNLPLTQFFRLDQELSKGVRLPKSQGWINVYKFFGNEIVWPRGFPLDRISESKSIECSYLNLSADSAPIFQVIADQDPDVDAIFRLTNSIPQYFNNDLPIFIGEGSITPFNSQATWWKRDVSLLMYFPSSISWRAADIWRSFIAQRILQRFKMGILYFGPLVKQIRNKHNLLVDFSQELDCYLHAEDVWNILSQIHDQELGNTIEECLLNCYTHLIKKGHIRDSELLLLNAWILDHNLIVANYN